MQDFKHHPQLQRALQFFGLGCPNPDRGEKVSLDESLRGNDAMLDLGRLGESILQASTPVFQQIKGIKWKPSNACKSPYAVTAREGT